MPAHSRSKNGVAEPVIGPATSGRTRWLAYVAGIRVFNAMLNQTRGWPEQVRP
jgi:glucuronate isomerase